VGGRSNPAQGEHGNLDAAGGAFWRAIIGAPGDALTLPARRARPATLPSEFASVKAAFGPRLAARVEALAAALAVPVPVAIFAALEAFLCRYAAQREIGIGIGAALVAEFNHESARADVLPQRAELAASSDMRTAVAKVADEIRLIAGLQKRWIKIASAFPVSPVPHNKRGINGTDWIRIDRATYDACLDSRDYRPKVKK